MPRDAAWQESPAFRRERKSVLAQSCGATRPSGSLIYVMGIRSAYIPRHAGPRGPGNRLLALIVQLARIEDWSLSGPGAGPPDPDRAWPQVQLG